AHLLHHDQQPQCIRGGVEEADGGVFGETLRKLKRLNLPAANQRLVKRLGG
ncbi:MAG: hypothetical protein RIS13_1019, partial [Bacteroidota bacterium]